MKKNICLNITFLTFIALSLGGCGGSTTSSINDNSNESGSHQDTNYQTTTNQGDSSENTSLITNPQILDEIYDNTSGVYYEIFVGSFYDSNNDGMGDLNGVKEKLPYLKELGISGVWLMPIMPSHSYHKYDVDNYYQIDSDYGTMEDFESLVSTAKEYNIDIIIDLVLNHTSRYVNSTDESGVSHNWFNESYQAYVDNDTSNPYYNWYNWSDASQSGYHSYNGVYYESQFDAGMPDLNLDNQNVRNEVNNIISFWLNKGVKGFRLDATTYYYSGSIDKNVEFLTYIRNCAKAVNPNCYIVGEAWDSKTLIESFSSSGNSFFAFHNSQSSSPGFRSAISGKSATAIGEDIEDYISTIRASSSETNGAYFISNHDMDRSGRAFAGQEYESEKLKTLASMYLLTPGNPFIYYGEEIGIGGSRGSNDNTDANRRLHMIWSESDKTGECDDPIGANYSSSLQVKKGANDLKDESTSLTYHYKKVINLRNEFSEYFLNGTYSYLAYSSAFFIQKYELNGSSIIVVVSIRENKYDLSLDHELFEGKEYQILDQIRLGDDENTISGTTVSVNPWSVMVLGEK